MLEAIPTRAEPPPSSSTAEINQFSPRETPEDPPPQSSWNALVCICLTLLIGVGILLAVQFGPRVYELVCIRVNPRYVPKPKPAKLIISTGKRHLMNKKRLQKNATINLGELFKNQRLQKISQNIEAGLSGRVLPVNEDTIVEPVETQGVVGGVKELYDSIEQDVFFNNHKNLQKNQDESNSLSFDMYHYDNATTKHHSVIVGDHATNATRR